MGNTVTGLPNRTDVNQMLLIHKLVLEINFFRGQKVHVLGKNARDMRVSLEAVLLNERENSFHLPLIVNVFRKDVLVERVSR